MDDFFRLSLEVSRFMYCTINPDSVLSFLDKNPGGLNSTILDFERSNSGAIGLMAQLEYDLSAGAMPAIGRRS